MTPCRSLQYRRLLCELLNACALLYQNNIPQDRKEAPTRCNFSINLSSIELFFVPSGPYRSHSSFVHHLRTFTFTRGRKRQHNKDDPPSQVWVPCLYHSPSACLLDVPPIQSPVKSAVSHHSTHGFPNRCDFWVFLLSSIHWCSRQHWMQVHAKFFRTFQNVFVHKKQDFIFGININFSWDKRRSRVFLSLDIQSHMQRKVDWPNPRRLVYVLTWKKLLDDFGGEKATSGVRDCITSEMTFSLASTDELACSESIEGRFFLRRRRACLISGGAFTPSGGDFSRAESSLSFSRATVTFPFITVATSFCSSKISRVGTEQGKHGDAKFFPSQLLFFFRFLLSVSTEEVVVGIFLSSVIIHKFHLKLEFHKRLMHILPSWNRWMTEHLLIFPVITKIQAASAILAIIFDRTFNNDYVRKLRSAESTKTTHVVLKSNLKLQNLLAASGSRWFKVKLVLSQQCNTCFCHHCLQWSSSVFPRRTQL